MKKLKPEFGKFTPPTECNVCDGTGEAKDELVGGFFTGIHWTYRKCKHCDGTGKNIWRCCTCKSPMQKDSWCSNKNCKMYNIKVALMLKGND